VSARVIGIIVIVNAAVVEICSKNFVYNRGNGLYRQGFPPGVNGAIALIELGTNLLQSLSQARIFEAVGAKERHCAPFLNQEAHRRKASIAMRELVRATPTLAHQAVRRPSSANYSF
jgi:hypothetical protein